MNPFIGTTNYGTVNPGAVLPHGLMSVTPFNVMGSDLNRHDKDRGWWATPYVADNSYLTGFSHVNLSGVGCPEASVLLLMPTAGQLEVDYHRYGSTYTAEHAEPGYYRTRLTRYNILAEATATLRCAIERFTFSGDSAHILLNLGQGLTRESGAWLRRTGPCEVEGMKLMGDFCFQRLGQVVAPLYFVARVSRTPRAFGLWKKQPLRSGDLGTWDPDNGRYKRYKRYGREVAGDDVGCWWDFDPAEGSTVEVRIGVSLVSTANARQNLERECAGLSFDEARQQARALWNNRLSRIKPHGGSREQLSVFYTALYHALIHPNIINDCNGEFPCMERDSVGRVEGRNRYTVFSLWDTYRTLHPLLSLVYPEVQTDMVRTLIDMQREWGYLPRWELYGCESYTMEGDPALVVIADTYRRGLKGFDVEQAYRAMRRQATLSGADNPIRPDADPYQTLGYIPVGYFSGDLSGDNSVSHALEYCAADWALSRLAADLGHKTDADLFLRRALSYRRYYSAETGTLRPITAEGRFLSPFSPEQGKNFEPVTGFHEGSAWNYTFAAPFDVEGLVRLMGGKQAFVRKLQSVFDSAHYDPTNEPDIVYPYLFCHFPDEAWRTQRLVKQLLGHYTTGTGGLPGNDDTGTLSAWAVWSMMGLYPDCPGEPTYALTTPTFSRIDIRLNRAYHHADSLVITTDGQGDYIDRIVVGGRRHKGYRIDHRALVGAGHIDFHLTPTPKSLRK